MNSERNLLSTASTGVSREEFELACIREFSHSGLQLGSGVSRAERRSRIRAAILKENKADLPWQGSGMCYAEAYRRAFNEPLGDYVVREDPGPALRRFGHAGLRDESDEEEDLDDAPDDNDEAIANP